MRWKSGRRSSNVEDRRHARAPVGTGMKLGGGTILFLLVATWALGGDPLQVLQLLGGSQGSISSAGSRAGRASAPTQKAPAIPENDEASQFVSVILAETEDTWKALFAQSSSRYQEPKLVLYSDAVQSACGFGSAASGPFYCPGDQKVYLDLSFLRQLKKLGASGDFAVAYVIAHEIGHHVQNITGTIPKVSQVQKRVGKIEANALQVRVELQADCYAGVWAHHGHQQRNILEQGDIEEGLKAAAAVGDDRLQRAAGQRVHPESFTHGSSKQRAEWFLRGFKSGTLEACDTFS